MRKREFQIPEILIGKQLVKYFQMDKYIIYRLAKNEKIFAMKTLWRIGDRP